MGMFNGDLPKRVPRRQVAKKADDSTVLRHFHGWTLDKLEVLERCLKVYRRVAGGGVYLDAFAGEARFSSTKGNRPVEAEGSAARAVHHGSFKRHILIELEASSIAKLEAFKAALPEKKRATVEIIQGDCNEVIPTLLAADDRSNARWFTLLDPDSTQLDFATVRALAGHLPYVEGSNPKKPQQCKVELWILFNDQQALRRMWPRDKVKHLEPIGVQRLDRVLGSRDAWQDLWDAKRSPTALRERYKELLEGLGYRFVNETPIRDPRTGAVQYHMIHASDHPAADRFMRWSRNAGAKEAGRGVELTIPGADWTE
jgi:three-Cys-motif partner protein